MKIEFEFYFNNVEIGDGTPRVAAVVAIREYLDKKDGIELVEVVDWEPEHPGIWVTAIIEGEEKDLQDIVEEFTGDRLIENEITDTWVDPAGGTHEDDEDPAAMYE